MGKNSLNLDSGKIASTVFTLIGLSIDPGLIASTKSFSSVHDVDSLKLLILEVIGSEEILPQIVPEQEDETRGGFGPGP